MIIPFSLPAMQWSWDPILDTYTKEMIWQIILEKGFLRVEEPCEVTWNLGWPFPCWMWCLVVSQQWCIAEARQSTKTGRTRPRWGCWATGPASHGATSMFDYFFCERLDLFFSQWIWVALLVITEATELRFCRSYTAEKWTLVGHLFWGVDTEVYLICCKFWCK